ncbi:hypothetical protein GGC64_005206 [Mycobacterium sp. OAS707]|nr:hypothetical protein [Mycobacterium sp. OAS707]
MAQPDGWHRRAARGDETHELTEACAVPLGMVYGRLADPDATIAAAPVVAVEHRGGNGCTRDLGEITAAALDLVWSGLAPLS